MSRDDLQPTDDATIRTEGEDQPSVEGGAELGDSTTRTVTEPVSLAGIEEIRATLDLLETQIVQYRRLLADEEASSRVGEVGEDEVGIVAVAGPLVDEVEGAVSDVAPEPLESPDVELPGLFAELESQLELELHHTASIAIYVDGEEVLLFLSSRDGSGVTPEPQPLFRAFSSGKAMAAAVVWRLLDSGVLEVDAPVASYWPEFAQRGKTGVTVRHVLTHTAGLPRDFGRGDVDWGDWGRMVDIIASMPLEYEPGEVIHYHSITFGILVAEVASRATGLRFAELFDREVATPLHLSDTRFLVDYEDSETRGRVKRLHVPTGYSDPAMPWKMDWLLDNQIVSPGATCITTADDLARLYATVCAGGVTPQSERWLSEAGATGVFAVHASAYDIESMAKLRVGQGVWMFDEQPNRMAAPVGSRAFGHGGMGTSIGWGDPDHNMGVAIITDTMQDEELNGKRLNRISAAIRRDLGLPVGVVAEF